jgi:hypothetical protein
MSKPRKSMRVATIFTGVACATFGVTQVANAQDAAKSVARHTSKRVGGAIHPAAKYDGSIRYASDCGNRGIDKNWLHISVTSYSGGEDLATYLSDCFGYAGTWLYPPRSGIRAECGGNNKGYLMGQEKNGDSWYLGFGPGTTYRTWNESHLDNVTINSWAGTDACGRAPDYGGGYMY